MYIAIWLLAAALILLIWGQNTLALILFIALIIFISTVVIFGRFFDYIYWENEQRVDSHDIDSKVKIKENRISKFLYEQYLKGVYWNDKRKIK
jgi:fatty acid desaturase